MLVTVENVSGGPLNALGVAEDGIATGGQRENPLPYPFTAPNMPNADGSLLDTESVQLPMQPRDWRHSLSQSAHNGDGLEVGEEINQMVNAGQITVAVAAQANRTDNEELYLNAV